MMIQELVTLDWYSGNLDADFQSPEVTTTQVTRSICFQGVATGNPVGTMSAEVCIIPGQWETLQGCESIAEDLSQTNTFYFVLPDIGDYGSALRLNWEHESGSTGSIDIALRILPN